MKRIIQNKILLLSLTIIFVLKVTVILSIGDRGWEPDSYMHFLQLRTVYYNFPDFLSTGISVWAKPLFTFPLGLPLALFGFKKLFIIQVINALIFTYISYLMYTIVDRIYQNKTLSYLALFLTSFSFLLFKSSLTALTEPIFTLFLILGLCFAVKRNYNIAAMFFGLSVLGRIEGIYFAFIFGLWIVVKKFLEIKRVNSTLLKYGIKFAGILLLPVFIWNFIGFLETGRALYVIDKGYPTDPGFYGYGSWIDFPKRLVVQEGLIMLLFLLSGIVFVCKKRYKDAYADIKIFSFVIFTGFTLLQMWFWVIGQFGSAGLMRYLISVMPFAILFSFILLDFVVRDLKINSTLLIISLVFLQSLVLVSNALGLGPISKKWIYFEDDLRIAGEWIRDNTQDDKFLGSIRPEVVYYSERDGDIEESAQNFRQKLINHKPGIYVWSTDWGAAFNLTLEDMRNNSMEKKNINDFIYVFEI